MHYTVEWVEQCLEFECLVSLETGDNGHQRCPVVESPMTPLKITADSLSEAWQQARNKAEETICLDHQDEQWSGIWYGVRLLALIDAEGNVHEAKEPA